MKQRLTSEDIACLIPVLNSFLDGAYLIQIYDGSEDNTRTLVMKFRNKINDECWLGIDSTCRFYYKN